MAKEILLYGHISEWNAMFFHNQIAEATEGNDDDLSVLVNSEGGQPEYGISIIQKVQQLADRISLEIGAMAHSMAFFLMCYIPKERITAIDVTKSVIHRAAYPSWFENSSDFKGSVYEDILVKTNKDLEKAFRASVDVDVFEALPQMKSKNITVKDIFSMDTRVEVMLSGSDLKKVGLVSKINKITPTRAAQMKTLASEFNNLHSVQEFKLAAMKMAATNTAPQQNQNAMTLQEFKTNHPDLFAQVIAEGVTKEKNRVEAYMVFAADDLEAVKKGIESGADLSAKQMAEFTHKMAGKAILGKVKTGQAGAEAGASGEAPLPEAEEAKAKEQANFMKEVNGSLKKLGVKTTVGA